MPTTDEPRVLVDMEIRERDGQPVQVDLLKLACCMIGRKVLTARQMADWLEDRGFPVNRNAMYRDIKVRGHKWWKKVRPGVYECLWID